MNHDIHRPPAPRHVRHPSVASWGCTPFFHHPLSFLSPPLVPTYTPPLRRRRRRDEADCLVRFSSFRPSSFSRRARPGDSPNGPHWALTQKGQNTGFSAHRELLGRGSDDRPLSCTRALGGKSGSHNSAEYGRISPSPKSKRTINSPIGHVRESTDARAPLYRPHRVPYHNASVSTVPNLSPYSCPIK